MSFADKIPAKIYEEVEIIRQCNRWRLEGRKIVFTNGVFDIIHRGHVDYLMKAADLGNELVIGLNSDSSAKMLNKGISRPIQDQDSRALILASFAFVSAIVIFSEPTPQDLIGKINPDILVKGGDYKIEEIAGSDFVLANNGEVITIPLVEGFSTTAIENRIKSS